MRVYSSLQSKDPEEKKFLAKQSTYQVRGLRLWSGGALADRVAATMSNDSTFFFPCQTSSTRTFVTATHDLCIYIHVHADVKVKTRDRRNLIPTDPVTFRRFKINNEMPSRTDEIIDFRLA